MSDTPRLVADAADALLDRAPIDWRAVGRRAGAGRPLIDGLHAIESLRSAAAPRPAGASPFHPLVVALAAAIAALAGVQTTLSLAVVGAALAAGETLPARAAHVALALAFGAASLRLALAAPHDARGLLLLATFLSAASAFSRNALLDLPASRTGWLTPLTRGLYPEAFTAACLSFFASDFPRVRRFTAFDVAARRASLVAAAVGGVLFTANLLVDRGIAGDLLRLLHRDDPAHWFWRAFTVGLTLPVAAIVVRARRAPVSERRRVARLASAIAAGSAPFLVAGLVRTVAPRADRLLSSPAFEAPWLDALIVGGLMAIPLLVTGALIADQPFDGADGPPASRPIGRRRAGRDRPRDLPGSLERLRFARGRRETGAALARELRATTGAAEAHVIVCDATPGSGDDRATPTPGGALQSLLCAAAGPLDLSPRGAVWPLLLDADRAWVARADVALAAPIMRRDGSLAAIVTLSERWDGAPFERVDRWFVASLLPAAAAMWEAEEIAQRAGRRRASTAGDADEAAFECERCGVVAHGSRLPCACGAPATLAALPHVFADKFLVRRRIGRGGMGVVYLARDVALDRDVVLKTLPAPGHTRPLQREARAMAALRHEALAAIHGVEVWRGTPVLVVEYFARGTLAARIAGRPIETVQALTLTATLVRALAWMHAHGLVHCDVKPANIGITDAGGVKLLDFGLASVTSARSRAGAEGDPIGAVVGGTPAYLPPEAATGDGPAEAADLWAVSVVALEAISGVNPFAAGARDADAALLLTDPDHRLPPTVREFFQRALADKPAQRFSTADDLAHAIETLIDTLRR